METNNRTPHHQAHAPERDLRLDHYQKTFNLTEDQLKAALRNVGNNYNLLEGFLRKNRHTLIRDHD